MLLLHWQPKKVFLKRGFFKIYFQFARTNHGNDEIYAFKQNLFGRQAKIIHSLECTKIFVATVSFQDRCNILVQTEKENDCLFQVVALGDHDYLETQVKLKTYSVFRLYPRPQLCGGVKESNVNQNRNTLPTLISLNVPVFPFD